MLVLAKKCYARLATFSALTLLTTASISSFFATNAWSYGMGISSHPLETDKSHVTTEFVGHISRGKGAGMQARFSRKLTSMISFDAGAGFADSERSGRFFLGSDIELFPDYEKQPRVSAKVFYENAKEFGDRRSIFGISPLVSKGFQFREHPIYPFVGLPLGVALNDNKRYDIRSQVALGATSQLPVEGYEKLLLNLEADINVSNSFTGIYLGLSLPLN